MHIVRERFADVLSDALIRASVRPRPHATELSGLRLARDAAFAEDAILIPPIASRPCLTSEALVTILFAVVGTRFAAQIFTAHGQLAMSAAARKILFLCIGDVRTLVEA